MPTQLLSVEIGRLMPDPTQPRKTFRKEEIDRMAASIAARGVLQPLRIRPDEERDCWWIVTGECRWRGALQAGLTHVPCLPVDGELSEEERLADQLIEDSVRNALRPLEYARAMAKLKFLKGCNSQTLAEKLGLSGAGLCRIESLLKLPADVQQLVDDGRLALSVAYVISRLKGEQAQRELALASTDRKLSREKVVEAVQGVVPKRNIVPRSSRLSCTVEGLSITVNGSEPLTFDGLLSSLDRLRRAAKKCKDDGKPIAELVRILRAS